jgi:hypothetical protein
MGNIDTVMIDGKLIKKDGQVLNVDWPKVRQDIVQIMPEFALPSQQPQTSPSIYDTYVLCSSDRSSILKF